MADKTAIEWTDLTWNPVAGCDILSPGCTNCYAMKMAWRLANNPKTPHYHGTVKLAKGRPVWTGKIGIAPDRVLTAPLRRRKPAMWFVNSMSDLFHESIPNETIDRVFAVMALCLRSPAGVPPATPLVPHHTFQVLTKRSGRMRAYLTTKNRRHKIADAAERIATGFRYRKGDGPTDWDLAVAETLHAKHWPLPNVWLGISAEDQKRADERIPDLLATPAAIRFVSAEPLLGPVDLSRLTLVRQQPGSYRAGVYLDALRGRYPNSGVNYTGDWDVDGPAPPLDTPPIHLDWIIVGGESGPGARPMHPDWVRDIRDQCNSSDTAFHFKQWGEWLPVDSGHPGLFGAGFGEFDHCPVNDPGNATHARTGKKRAGRRLDGIEHNGFPDPARNLTRGKAEPRSGAAGRGKQILDRIGGKQDP